MKTYTQILTLVGDAPTDFGFRIQLPSGDWIGGRNYSSESEAESAARAHLTTLNLGEPDIDRVTQDQ